LGDGLAYNYGSSPAGTRKPLESTKFYGNFESIVNYGNFEPRFAANYVFNEKSSIKASYNRMAQNLHLISNTSAATPLDVWTPSTNNIKPQLADQVALGYFRNFNDNMFEASVEVYYKDLQNQIDYIDGADLFLNTRLEGELLSGKGRAYGAEFFLRKNKGKLTGWVSYTLARTERLVNGVNKNDWFPTRFDKPHTLNMVAIYEIKSNLTVSANFALSSGTPSTFPTDKFYLQDVGYVPNNADETRNSFRIPMYHRLDLALTWDRPKPNRRWQGSWVFSVYNAYNRRNPYSVFFRQNPDDMNKTEAIQYSVFGSILPSVTYNFKF
jgi:hypothetical protein